MGNWVTVTDPYEGTTVGRFDRDRAERWEEALRWDGRNCISKATGDQWSHQALYRTAGGRWVLCRYSDYQHKPTRYGWIDPVEAKAWLIAQGESAAAETHFGSIEETGPAVELGRGRPEIGGRICVRLGEDLLEQLDGWAAAHDVARAEAVRQLLAATLPPAHAAQAR